MSGIFIADGILQFSGQCVWMPTDEIQNCAICELDTSNTFTITALLGGARMSRPLPVREHVRPVVSENCRNYAVEATCCPSHQGCHLAIFAAKSVSFWHYDIRFGSEERHFAFGIVQKMV